MRLDGIHAEEDLAPDLPIRGGRGKRARLLQWPGQSTHYRLLLVRETSELLTFFRKAVAQAPRHADARTVFHTFLPARAGAIQPDAGGRPAVERCAAHAYEDE